MVYVIEAACTLLIRIVDAISHEPVVFIVMDDDQRRQFTSDHRLLNNRDHP